MAPRDGRAADDVRPPGSPVAVAAVFAASGLAMASAVSRMPQIRIQVGASPTELAFALVCVGIGSVLAMPFAGHLVHRFSSAWVCRVSVTIALLGWSLVPLAHSVPILALILLFTGSGIGVWDVSMNVQGTVVERARSVVLMPMWHGLFSIGAVAGALAGAAAARWELPLGVQLPVVAGLLWGCAQAGSSWFIRDDMPGPAASAQAASARPAGAPPGDTPDGGPSHGPGTGSGAPTGRITRTEILLGLITLGTALGEGAANDWLALALVDNRGAPAAVGALTYAGFNLTMAIGRFTGGPLIARHGRVRALRVGGVVAAAGIVVLCLVPGTVPALLGAAAWGLGLSVVFPSAMSAAGEVPGRGSRAIATVSTIGYGGFLLGAPLIGLLARVMPLLRALLVVALVVMIIVVLAPAARERRPPARRVSAGG
jgi:MFS family permease